MDIGYVIRVIMSCLTWEQLLVARLWANRVNRLNGWNLDHSEYIKEIYRYKKELINEI